MIRFKRIRTRILTVILIPTVVILVSVIWVLEHHMSLHAVNASRALVGEKVRALAVEVDKQNLEAITIVRVMAEAQRDGLFGKRDLSVRFARRILEAYPELQAAYFGYEPDADGQDRTADRSRATDSDGRFLPYWHRRDGEVALEPLVNMESSLYYRGAKNRYLGVPETRGVALPMEGAGEIRTRLSSLYTDARERAARQRAIITEPYNYEGTYIVEQTYPIVIDGTFRGVAGVDRRLDSITAFLGQKKQYHSADIFLISRRGRIITATMDTVNAGKDPEKLTAWEKRRQLPTKKIEETPYRDILVDFYTGTPGKKVKDQFVTDPVLRRPYLYAAARVTTGDWLVVMRVSRDEITAPVKRSLSYAIVMAGVGLFVVICIIFIFGSSVTSELGKVVSAARRVANGDLTIELATTQTDETGQLLDAVGTMTRDLSSLIAQVKSAAVQVQSIANVITATCKGQEESVAEFGLSTAEIAAAAKEISATASGLVKSVEEVADVGASTAALAAEGRTGLSAMEQMMRTLAEATDVVSEKLSLIRDKAGNIGDVINTIIKVADQTNLLSLNAAIEAEKAGEHGGGFSVVAQEIRRLADQTAVATLDIEKTVHEMYSAIAVGVLEMNRFSEQVSNGVRDAGRINRQLARIMEQVETLPPRFGEVTDGMRSQSDGAEQISLATSQLAQTAKRSQSSAQEFADAATDLQRAVAGLRQEVSRFVVKKRAQQ